MADEPNPNGNPNPNPEGDPKPDAGDKKPDAPPQKVVPEKYDLKLPEGTLLDAGHIEKTSAIAKKLGLSNEEAQALVDSDNANIAAYAEAQQKQLKEQVNAWMEEVKADKEIGGEQAPKNVELAKRVLKRFGTDAFLKTLDDTGLGNHPELVRVFVRIGKGLDEDQLVLPGSQPPKPKSAAEILYDHTPKKE